MSKVKYYFNSDTAKQILRAMTQKKNRVEVSVDLNRSVTCLLITKDRVILDNKNKLKKSKLLFILKKENRIFVIKDNLLRALEYRNRGYYKLVPTMGAPTVEINGIKMHRTKGIDPFTDAQQKAKEVVGRGDRVLDTCGGIRIYSNLGVAIRCKRSYIC